MTLCKSLFMCNILEQIYGPSLYLPMALQFYPVVGNLRKKETNLVLIIASYI